MSRHSYAFSAFSATPRKGGLIQVVGPLAEATQRLKAWKLSDTYFFWISDEGLLYPEAVQTQWPIPLSRLLLVKAHSAMEAWQLTLEAVQTGLFGCVFLHVSRSCLTAHLRKLQLVAEKMRCLVFIKTPHALPHWTLKETMNHAYSLHSQRLSLGGAGRKQLHSNPQNRPLLSGALPGDPGHTESFGG